MGKWTWVVLAMLAVAAVATPAVIVRGAEGGPPEGERRMPERAVQQPAREAGPAEMEAQARKLRERVEVLRHAADMLEQQGMPDMAREVRGRAEQTQHELEGLMQAMQRREGEMRREGPPPERAMAEVGDATRQQGQIIEKLMGEQERLRAQVNELNERVNALQRELGGLRERMPR